MRSLTEQETFWAGDFGNEYLKRNRGADLVASNAAFFSQVLRKTVGVRSILELGSNIGLNLMALRQLAPATELAAVEINENAAAELRKNVPSVTVFNQSILDFHSDASWDLTFTKGVLIHIAPEALPQVYETLYGRSSRYILVAEYYNPAPVEVPYRGHSGKLFKRDWAGDLLDKFPDLRLLDYGFVYRRDPVFPQDDMTWFLLEKA